jgi:hypothetical protein
MAKNIIKAYFVGDTSDLERKSKQAGKDIEGVGEKSKKTSGVAKAAFAGLAAGAIAFGKSSIDAAAEDEKAQALLKQALEKTTGATKQQVDQMDSFVTKTAEATGTAKSDLYPALTNLVSVTHNQKESQTLLNTALDISARTGKPLAQVTTALGRAYNGNTTALSKLGIQVKTQVKDTAAIQAAQKKVTASQLLYTAAIKAHGKNSAQARAAALNLLAAQHNLDVANDKSKKSTKGFNQILGDLNKTYGGSSKAAADTAEGGMKRLGVQWKEMQEQVGKFLLPIIKSLVKLFLDHKGVVLALAGVVAGLVVGFYTYKAVTTAVTIAQGIAKAATATWTAAQWLLNAALNANPIGLIVIAIAAFIAGIVLAYQHVGWFRDLVNGAFKIIKGAIETAFNWVKDHWPLLLAILTGPIGLAVFFIVQHWHQIVDVFNGVVRGIASGVSSIVGFITGLPGRIAGAAVAFGSTLLHGFLNGIGAAAGAAFDFIQTIGRAMDNLIDKFIIDPIRGVHIKWGGFHGIGAFDIHPFDFIPRLHSGGVFNAGSAGEGLALLRNGEVVFTPEQLAVMGGRATVINNWPAGVDPAAVNSSQRRYNRINGVTT